MNADTFHVVHKSIQMKRSLLLILTFYSISISTTYIAKHTFLFIKMLSELKMDHSRQVVPGFKKTSGHYLSNIAEKDRTEWNKVLGRVEVNSNNIDNLHAFCFCLYRSFIIFGNFYK